MAGFPECTIRFPPSLMLDVRMASEREGQSLDGFVVQAVAEKVAALRARGLADALTPEEQLDYLNARASRAGPGAFARIVNSAGTTTDVLPGDEWPEADGAKQDASGSADQTTDSRMKDDPVWGTW